jgi:hypothetical protein
MVASLRTHQLSSASDVNRITAASQCASMALIRDRQSSPQVIRPRSCSTSTASSPSRRVATNRSSRCWAVSECELWLTNSLAVRDPISHARYVTAPRPTARHPAILCDHRHDQTRDPTAVTRMAQPQSTLAEADLPGLFRAADGASGRGQRSYFRSMAARLGLAVLAAVSGAVTLEVASRGIDAAAIVTTLAFVGVLVVDVFESQTRPGADWYRGRALAESVKTLAWRYAVGGAPFPLDVGAEEAENRFLTRIESLLRDLPTVIGAPSRGPAITAAMRDLRGRSLAERQQAYLTGRIGDQQEWYAARAEQHGRRANRLQAAGMLLEILGVAAALCEVLRLVTFDLAGIIAAMIAALAAWMTGKQYRANSTAYTLASHELALVRTRLELPVPEPEWSGLVADAEAAISREHTTWRASHRH